MNDLISVIVPIYNVEKYLDKCVKSIIEQTYKNLEIILVDDGSTDGSVSICDEWAKRDKRIIVIHKTNGGLSDARNAGLKVARGKFVGFVDSDDYIFNTMYEKLYQKTVETNADMTLCGIIHEYEDGSTQVLNEVNLKNVNSENILEFYTKAGKKTVGNEIITENIMGSVCRVLYKKSFINNKFFEYGMFCEDLVFNSSLITKNTKIAIVEDHLYVYLQRSGSILHTFDMKKYEKRLQFTNRIIDILESKVSNTSFCSYKFQLYLVFLNEIFLSNNSKEILKLLLQSDIFTRLNNKVNYKIKQKETKLFVYKVANFVAYKKMFKLYSFFVRKLKR